MKKKVAKAKKNVKSVDLSSSVDTTNVADIERGKVTVCDFKDEDIDTCNCACGCYKVDDGNVGTFSMVDSGAEMLVVHVGNNEYPASKEDIKSVQEQFAIAAKDPNSILVTNHAISFSYIPRRCLGKWK